MIVSSHVSYGIDKRTASRAGPVTGAGDPLLDHRVIGMRADGDEGVSFLSAQGQRTALRLFLSVCGLGSLVGLALVSHRQVGYWRTTAILFARDMVTQGAHPILLNLAGYEAFDQGDFSRAIPFCMKPLVGYSKYRSIGYYINQQ